MYLSPNWMLRSVQSAKHFFFSKYFEQSTSWCFASHFFVARSHQFIATCHSHFLAPFLKEKAWKENFFVNFSLCITNCSNLARHPLKFATLLSIKFCSSRSWAMRVSCLVLTSHDRNLGFSAADDAAVRSVVFVFIQINTFTYLKKTSMYQTNSVYVNFIYIVQTACMLTFIYIVQCKWYLRFKISVQGPFKHDWAWSPNGWVTTRLCAPSEISLESNSVQILQNSFGQDYNRWFPEITWEIIRKSEALVVGHHFRYGLLAYGFFFSGGPNW